LQDDFNNQLWNVVMLAMGGSALGEAVKSSGLLKAIAHGIQDLIVDYGTWEVLVIFCALVLVATTFISHTVGAMVILPIVQAVGADMSVSHPTLLSLSFTCCHIMKYWTLEALAVLCGLLLVAATFISHTVEAMVILPIVQAVGADMSLSHTYLALAPYPFCCTHILGI